MRNEELEERVRVCAVGWCQAFGMPPLQAREIVYVSERDDDRYCVLWTDGAAFSETFVDKILCLASVFGDASYLARESMASLEAMRQLTATKEQPQ